MQTSRVNNSRFIRISNAKFPRYDLEMDPNIEGDFQICISQTLILFHKKEKQTSAVVVYLFFFSFCSLFYVDANFLFTNLQMCANLHPQKPDM